MFKYGMALLIPLLLCGCAKDLWQDVPKFEVLDFTCPAQGSKFLDDDNFVSAWSILGPLDPGGVFSIHGEHMRDEGMLNGNCRAPRGTSWFRVRPDRSDDIYCGQINFTPKFAKHRKGSKPSAFYACATLKCSRDHAGMVMHLISLGKVKVWINGKPVYANEKSSPDMKADPVQIRDLLMQKGCNRLVVKYMDNGEKTCGKRVFSLRFTDAAGNLSTVR